MKKLSRDDELRLLAETKNLIRNDTAAEEMARWFDTAVSDRVKFALQGAQWEALALMPEPSEGEAHRSVSTTIPPDMVAMMIAGMMRCLPRSCEHVRTRFDVAKHVFLSPRICSCKPCIISFESQ